MSGGVSSGIFTGLAFLAFLGVTCWAYSRRNRARFEDAAQLPLTEDPQIEDPPIGGGAQRGCQPPTGASKP